MKTFKTGAIVETRGVNIARDESINFDNFVHKSLQRHIACDWGDLSEEDKQLNDEGLSEDCPDRLMSAYEFEDKKIWIITEWDRSSTTILFPSEY